MIAFTHTLTAFAQSAIVVWLQSGVLLLLSLATLWGARRQSPVLRTLMGRCFLAGVAAVALAAPVISFLPPFWTVPLPSTPAISETQAAPPSPASYPIPTHSITIPLDASAASGPISPADQTPLIPLPLSPTSIVLETLALVWVIGGVLRMIWIALCQISLLRLRRGATAITSGPIRETLSALTPHPPQLYTHKSVASPFLAGALRPAIFLPQEFVQNSSATEQRAVLAHELAHLSRRDCAWNLAAHLLCVLLWPQPLLWILRRQIEHISEDACDLAVLEHDCPSREYANVLLTLAERRQPSLVQQTLSAGVVPFRSAVGRRIQRILSTSLQPAQALTRRLRLGVTAGVLTAAAFSVLLLGSGVDASHFEWAKQQGWSVRPVRVLQLEHPSPFQRPAPNVQIPDSDQALVKSIPFRETTYGKQGPPLSQRKQLEQILAQHPRFFYAEYLLGSWLQQHGDTRHGDELTTRALHDAPVIIGGRVEYEDGTPVAGLRIITGVTCYSTGHLRQQDATELNYSYITTDKDGCYYLPAYRGICSQVSRGYSPEELNTLTSSKLHSPATLQTPGPPTSGSISDDRGTRLQYGFVCESRVGVLPAAIVRPRVALHMPFKLQSSYSPSPVLFIGKRLEVRWDAYPRAATYQMIIMGWLQQFSKEGQFSSETGRAVSIPSLTEPTSDTHKTIDLAGANPPFDRRYLYSISVAAFDSHGEMLSQSDEYNFRPNAAFAPHSLTKEALAQVLAPDITITSMQIQGDKVTVEAMCAAEPHDVMEKLRESGASFGLQMQTFNMKSWPIAGQGQQLEIIYRPTQIASSSR
ncbi:hypothetical protein CCAX7_18890 [Capsulimonas corticalis]|uniref:Uncharacterized protein n=1 Tax=Capsulimonas corticalis TaxID=2219043 RepID=A0A402D5G6_9BACT|nr:M56 family metallopeptidase [Capsulimonas corticalis]BDI29838.1 hypothetical protein CCAX7_18890 [Capsulimonas corticalis]